MKHNNDVRCSSSLMRTHTAPITLGVDPGMRVTGYALIQYEMNKLTVMDWGIIRFSQQFSHGQRLQKLYEQLEKYLEHHHPGTIAIETPYVGRNPQAALTLGMARGVVALLAQQKGITLAEYAPARVKKSICSHGRSSKEEVYRWLRRIVHWSENLEGEAPDSLDASDALAVAACHAFNSQRHPALS